jgi:hypothetical protein
MVEPASQLLPDMIDSRLQFVPLALQMVQRVFQYFGVPVRFFFCHDFSTANYIMENGISID